MEIFELRYFLGVAQKENIHRAADQLHVSPGSLSKAIARLESELGVKLFERDGRGIRLTDLGRTLQQKASEIVHLEESAKTSIAGDRGTLKIDVAGSEVLLAHFGLDLVRRIKKRFPGARFEFHATKDVQAAEQVLNGESHIAIITGEPPITAFSNVLGEAKFHTFVGKGHPLYKAATNKKIVPINEVLKYGFVSPSLPFLGAVGAKQAPDGWRDDKFPRTIDYVASSLKVMEEITARGWAIAYLPDYLADSLTDTLPAPGAGLAKLKISGCPYTCVQKIRAIYRSPKEIGWLSQIF